MRAFADAGLVLQDGGRPSVRWGASVMQGDARPGDMIQSSWARRSERSRTMVSGVRSCFSTWASLRHETRALSDHGSRRTRVRSAVLCLAPSVATTSLDGTPTTTGRRPIPCGSFDASRPSRSRAPVEKRTASRPRRLTIPIAVRRRGHAVQSNRVYPHSSALNPRGGSCRSSGQCG